MERRSVVNASRQSFEPAVNNEATKSPSVAARAGTREWKRPPAPGEIPVKALSDGGSTPPISTMSEQALYRLLRLFYKSRSALMPLLLLSKSQPLRWIVIWFGQILWITASILFGLRMSEQALYRLLRLFYKSRSALMPLLLLSKSQPLRWVVIWFGQIRFKESSKAQWKVAKLPHRLCLFISMCHLLSQMA